MSVDEELVLARKRRDDREASTIMAHLIVLLDSALDCEDTTSHGNNQAR